MIKCKGGRIMLRGNGCELLLELYIILAQIRIELEKNVEKEKVTEAIEKCYEASLIGEGEQEIIGEGALKKMANVLQKISEHLRKE